MANRVTLAPEYFGNPTIGRPIANGSVYVGEIDLNPKIEANQKQISVLQEDGTEVEVSQPLGLSGGGYPTYNGSPVTILVTGSYSLRVDDKNDAQVYYVPKNAEATGDKTVETIADLRLISGDYANQGVNIQGYYAVGDGGGGQFYWDDSSTDADNDGTIIKATAIATGRWIRLDKTTVDIRWFGAYADVATDSTTAIQAAFDYAVANNIPISCGDGETYQVYGELDLLQTVQDRDLKIDIRGNNSIFDFSNLSGSEVGLTIGADSQAHISDHGEVIISNLRGIGPEASPLIGVAKTTSTVGISLTYAPAITLNNVDFQAFYVGIKTFFVFPLTATNCIFKKNYIGILQNETSNVHYWLNTDLRSCWYSTVIEHTNTLSTKIQDITHQGAWFEGSDVGCHISVPDSNRVIRGVTFRDGFYKDVTYDIFRMGLNFNFATPGTRPTTPDTGKIYDINVYGGAFDGNAATATKSTFIFGVSGPASEEVKDFRASVSIERGTTPSEIVGSPGRGYIEYRSSESTASTNNITDYYEFSEVVRTLEQDGTITTLGGAQAWTPVLTCATPGNLSVAYTTQIGQYNVIGNMVVVDFYIVTSTFTHTTASGAISLTGLPYVVAGEVGLIYTGTSAFLGVTKANTEQANSTVAVGDSDIGFLASSISGGTIGVMQIADLPTGGAIQIRGSITYLLP